jgi:hypothetical protein
MTGKKTSSHRQSTREESQKPKGKIIPYTQLWFERAGGFVIVWTAFIGFAIYTYIIRTTDTTQFLIDYWFFLSVIVAGLIIGYMYFNRFRKKFPEGKWREEKRRKSK